MKKFVVWVDRCSPSCHCRSVNIWEVVKNKEEVLKVLKEEEGATWWDPVFRELEEKGLVRFVDSFIVNSGDCILHGKGTAIDEIEEWFPRSQWLAEVDEDGNVTVFE